MMNQSEINLNQIIFVRPDAFLTSYITDILMVYINML